MSNKIEIGKRIKDARKKAGLRQEDVANYLGIGKSSISEWEKGLRSPDIDQIDEIAKILNTTHSYILGWDISDDTRNKLQSIFGGSSEEADFSSDALSLAPDFDRLDDWGQSFIQSVMQMVIIEHSKS